MFYSCFLHFFYNHTSLTHDNFAWPNLLVTMALFNQQESAHIQFLINHEAYTMELEFKGIPL